MSATVQSLTSRLPRPRRNTVLGALVLVNVQALFVLSYASVVDRTVLDPFLWYPFVWIDVGLWALLRTDPPEASPRARATAVAISIGYFLLLAVASNTIALGERFGGNPAIGTNLRLFSAPPGWAPALLHNGPWLHLSLMPPYVVGFLALSYLVYATVLDARGVASLGLIAALSCVSCTLPVLAAGVALVTGVSASTLLMGSGSYLLPAGTALYVATIALLYWRPGVSGTANGEQSSSRAVR